MINSHILEEKNQKHWEKECRKYEKSFVKWLEENYDKWTEFMDHKLVNSQPINTIVLISNLVACVS